MHNYAVMIMLVGILCLLADVVLMSEVQHDSVHAKDVCTLEVVHLKCIRNEAILVKSAVYGRMAIGRCLRAEEVEAHRAVVGDDRRYLGCSSDVLSVLDLSCSGKTECEVRLSDIPEESFQPCFPGLKMYLRLTFSCINIADDRGSCSAFVSSSLTPINIMANESNALSGGCGSKRRPWIVRSVAGQKIALRLLELGQSNSDLKSEYEEDHCQELGFIRETEKDRNTSICSSGKTREKDLYISSGNRLEIYLNSVAQQAKTTKCTRFILELKGVGCSDIIPPEDAWLKRDDERLVVGCYSSRLIWRLNCEYGRWTGALGNCTAKAFPEMLSESAATAKSALSNKAQVLSIVAISGFTVAVCLIIVCIGVVYLNRFYGRKRDKENSAVNYGNSSVKSEFFRQRIDSHIRVHNKDKTQDATYSLYVGETDISNA